MRSTTTSLMTAALAGAVLLAAAPPAEAGKACSRLGLASPCIKSNDVKARINLDEDGKDARLRLRDAAGENAVELNASSGNLTNLFSNDENASNGLVKAWARINTDGTVDACWRCDPGQTTMIGTGIYKVDFTPLSTDVRGRPRSAVPELDFGSISTTDEPADNSSVRVGTIDRTGDLANLGFVLIIY